MTAGICVVNGVWSCVCVRDGTGVCCGGTLVVATVTSMDPSGGDSTSPYMYGGVGGFSPLTVIWSVSDVNMQREKRIKNNNRLHKKLSFSLVDHSSVKMEDRPG